MLLDAPSGMEGARLATRPLWCCPLLGRRHELSPSTEAGLAASVAEKLVCGRFVGVELWMHVLVPIVVFIISILLRLWLVVIVLRLWLRLIVVIVSTALVLAVPQKLHVLHLFLLAVVLISFIDIILALFLLLVGIHLY